MKKFLRVLAVPVLATGLIGCADQARDSSTDVTSEEDIARLVEEQVNAAVEQVESEKAEKAEAEQTETKEETKQQQEATSSAQVPAVKLEIDQSGMTHVQVTSNDANIRQQASLTSQVVYAGAIHDMFEYLREKVHTSDGRTWYKVSYGSGIGYMSSAVGTLINMNTQATYNNGGNSIIITSSDGNVRSEPSLNGAVIYAGKKGESLQYTGDAVNASDGRTWYKVIVNGNIGFISKKVASLSEDYYYDIGKSEFLITSAEGNVRAQPSMKSPVIYKGTKGEKLYYTGYFENTSDGRTWYEVSVTGTYGYISGKVGHVQ